MVPGNRCGTTFRNIRQNWKCTIYACSRKYCSWYVTQKHNLTTINFINTKTSGVYRRNENIEIFIDITRVEALRSHSIGTNVILGGNMSLTETMEVLKKASNRSGFQYVKYLVDHIDLIANVPVRNVI